MASCRSPRELCLALGDKLVGLMRRRVCVCVCVCVSTVSYSIVLLVISKSQQTCRFRKPQPPGSQECSNIRGRELTELCATETNRGARCGSASSPRCWGCWWRASSLRASCRTGGAHGHHHVNISHAQTVGVIAAPKPKKSEADVCNID